MQSYFVKTINGLPADINGNIVIDAGGSTPTLDQVLSAGNIGYSNIAMFNSFASPTFVNLNGLGLSISDQGTAGIENDANVLFNAQYISRDIGSGSSSYHTRVILNDETYTLGRAPHYKFPDKVTGIYNLATTEDVTLQSILNNDKNATITGETSYVHFLSGTTNNREFYLQTDDGGAWDANKKMSFIYIENTFVELQNRGFNKRADLSLIDGEFVLSQNSIATSRWTYLKFAPPASTNTVILIPAKPLGTYTLATLDDITGGATPTLQEVLTAGNITDKNIRIEVLQFDDSTKTTIVKENSVGLYTINSGGSITGGLSEITQGIVKLGNGTSQILLDITNPSYQGIIGKNTTDTRQTTLDLGNRTATGNAIYHFAPGRPAGTYTIATIEDISNTVQVTRTELLNLIANSLLVPNFTYKITGVCKTGSAPSGVPIRFYDDGTNSGTTIYLKAITTNKLAHKGYGEFWNPKYDQEVAGYGIYNDLIQFTGSITSGEAYKHFLNGIVTSNDGKTGVLKGSFYNNLFKPDAGQDFSASTSITVTAPTITGSVTSSFAISSDNPVTIPTIGSKVIWGGYVWINTTGNIGSSTNYFTLSADWTKITYSSTDYNFAIDEVIYDIDNDWLEYRREDLGNNSVYFDFNEQNNYWSIVSPIALFQFGNPLLVYGEYKGLSNITVENGFFDTINFRGDYLLYVNVKDSNIDNFYCNTKGVIYNLILKDSIWNDIFLIDGRFEDNRILASSFSNLTLHGGSTIKRVSCSKGYLTLSSSIFHNFSTLEKFDLSADFTLQNSVLENSQLNSCVVHFTSGIYGETSNIMKFTTKTISKIIFEGSIILKSAIGDLNSATKLYETSVKTIITLPDNSLKIRSYDSSGNFALGLITD